MTDSRKQDIKPDEQAARSSVQAASDAGRQGAEAAQQGGRAASEALRRGGDSQRRRRGAAVRLALRPHVAPVTPRPRWSAAAGRTWRR